MRLAHHAAAIVLVGLVMQPQNLPAQEASATQIARGRYLTHASDCIACHTVTKDKPFAGGRPIETPFGIIYSPNITPDRNTGIGAWSDEEFYNALHRGIAKGGKRLYPAFPYAYFTKLSKEDVLAIRAYLNTLEPVRYQEPANELYWPFNFRFLLRFWNWLFFEPGQYVPNRTKSVEWNRGAYLVDGPGHCGSCHTPKNLLGGDKTSQYLMGSRLQDWFAPKITADRHDGLGAWSVDDIVEYLRTGRNRHSGATGLMAEVVANSTSKLERADLRAIAEYLKSVESEPEEPPEQPGVAVLRAGEAIFRDTCAACHQNNGQGVPRMFPPLSKNPAVNATNPATTIRIILQGAQTVPTQAQPTPSTMPAFNWKLNDAEIAAVATFVRNHWGNSAPAVSEDDVKQLREALRAREIH